MCNFAYGSLNLFQAATKIAEKELSPTNPIRLGLALNLSVFYYEIMGSPVRYDATVELDFELLVYCFCPRFTPELL